MKYKDKNDSIKKVSLIDELGASISYNMAAATRPWSDLNLNLRLKLSKSYTFSMSSSFKTYGYAFDKNGNVVPNNRTEWSYGRFGIFQGYGSSFSYTFNNDTWKKWMDKLHGVKEDDAGKKGDGYGFARQIEGACLVAVEVALVPELRYIPEHGAALHMVAIQEVEAVGEIPFVLAVQEDGAGEGELALHILVDILHIILPLYHRVVDMGIVHGDPGADIGIEFQQLFKGEALRVVR